MSSATVTIDPPDGHLLGSCWCGRGYVHVSVTDVREGRTHPCRRKTCKPTTTEEHR